MEKLLYQDRRYRNPQCCIKRNTLLPKKIPGTPHSFCKPSTTKVVPQPNSWPAPTGPIPTISGATTLSTGCNTVDVEQLSPHTIWLKLCNNHKDIDYCLTIQKLIDLNFDPFRNTPRPDTLFMTCLDFISDNSYLIEDNLPPFIYLNLDYYEQLKNSYQNQLYKHFK